MRFDYVIFRYNDKNNTTSPYIIIDKLNPDYATMIQRIGRKHPRINLLYYIRDNIITDSDIRLSTRLECIKPDLFFQDVYRGLMEVGKD